MPVTAGISATTWPGTPLPEQELYLGMDYGEVGEPAVNIWWDVIWPVVLWG